MSPDATSFRLAPLAAASRGTREQERAAGYAAGWAAGARVAAEQGEQVRARLTAEHQAAEQRRDDEVRAAVQRLSLAARAADDRVIPVVTDARRVLAHAALELAEAVLGRELSDGPTSARAALDRALSAEPSLGVQAVRLAPADHAALLAAGVALPEDVTLVADPRVAAGDAVSELADGFLDAQVATALDRARRALLGEDS
ncbi:FliH/SctL family protein [Isoptericola sp. b441]|uniref:FliH/SctL family protein n=1 Tax=Actinotalea lenta TaxID=3064654 RepID=A0ABT9D9Z2_9CELL|nr:MULTISPECIES: FliH/SctL family protein [unclassified Isoptericola]MDO8106121.1 FliH/SctL family protein [Isoptericola sp. b441]MDO8122160.1 FliH/SctL family protein [Isoptericola sp. b490]